MNPDDISRLAEEERKRKTKEEEQKKKEPFNPFDWMDFKKTRDWMGKNLALSDRYYSGLLLLLMAAGLLSYIYLGDEETWAFYAMIILWIAFFLCSVTGFVYGMIKKRIK